MPSKEYWAQDTKQIFAKIKKENKPSSIKVLGKDFIILPNVFSPKYFTDTEWFSKEVPKIVGKKKVLEIGTGAGIVAVFMALNGSKQVIATDINPIAVKNARLNFRKHGFYIPVRHGDMYKPIKPSEKFDYIFWNHPFNYANEKIYDRLLKAGFDYRYQGLRKFIKYGRNHLTDDGVLLLGSGAIARIRKIQELARRYHYSIKLVKKKKTMTEYQSGIEMDIRIYELKPKRTSRY